MPKHLVPQTHTNTNKKLHNLFPISVHTLLAKLNYQCSSLLHVGHRNVPNRRRHPNNLRQREQLPKTTPLARQMKICCPTQPKSVSLTACARISNVTWVQLCSRLQQVTKRRVDQHPAVTAVPETPRAPISIAMRDFALVFVAIYKFSLDSAIRYYGTSQQSLVVCVRSSFAPA